MELATQGRMVELVAAHLDTVVRRAARRAKDEIPVYESVPELEIRQGIARDVAIVYSLVLDDRMPSDDERQELGIIGDTRARQRLPLESMLRVYRITLDETFRVVWSASETGELSGDEALELTREIWRRADDAMEMAVAAYRHRELELAAAETERRAAMLHALLFSPAGAPEAMILDAGLDPDGEYVAFRARVPNGATQALLFDLQLPGVLKNGVAGLHGDDVVGFASERPRLAPRDGAVVGIGVCAGIGDLARSFTIASRVVDAAVTFGRTGLLTINDVALEAIAGSEDALGAELVRRYVADHAADLVHTVRALLANDLSTERTADALGVHPNTVRKRISRYEQLTDSSLQRVDDVLRIRLALLRAAAV